MEKEGLISLSRSDSSSDGVAPSPRLYASGKPARYYRPFKSSRVPDDFVIPLQPRSKTEVFARRLPFIAAFFGILMVFAGAYWGYAKVPKYKFSKVIWYEDFTGANYDFLTDFNREVAFDGFGANSVEFNTDYSNNSFVKDGKLHIRTEFADPYFNTDGVKVNLTEEGRCTVAYTESACVATRNTSRGSFFNPVNSARLTTKGKHSLRYGRVEIRAKLPLGNWLWPAMWLLPVNTTYGIWPASGEIDMLEARGNKPGFPAGGYDTMQSSVHMAPVGQKLYSNNGKNSHPIVPQPNSDPPREFHTYGMDWTPQGIRVWVDSPIYATVDWKFKTDPFTNFNLPASDEYGKSLDNPWTISSHKSAPFDQDFYLILNVAVGRGYFGQTADMPYAVDATPWIVNKQMWESQDELTNTWDTKYRDLEIDFIRMSALDDVNKWENLPRALYY